MSDSGGLDVIAARNVGRAPRSERPRRGRRRWQRRAEVVSLLQASGMSTSTVVQADLASGALEQLDAIVMCGGSPSATAKFATEIRLEDSSPRIVAVLQSADPKQLRELLGAGVDGIVLEAETRDTLVVTVRAVCAGQLVVPADLWQRLARPALSTREKQALAMVVMGFSNAEIARKLFVTEATVKSHLSSSFSKLGVRSRAEATARILDPEHGLGTGILRISDDGRADG